MVAGLLIAEGQSVVSGFSILVAFKVLLLSRSLSSAPVLMRELTSPLSQVVFDPSLLLPPLLPRSRTPCATSRTAWPTCSGCSTLTCSGSAQSPRSWPRGPWRCATTTGLCLRVRGVCDGVGLWSRCPGAAAVWKVFLWLSSVQHFQRIHHHRTSQPCLHFCCQHLSPSHATPPNNATGFPR